MKPLPISLFAAATAIAHSSCGHRNCSSCSHGPVYQNSTCWVCGAENCSSCPAR